MAERNRDPQAANLLQGYASPTADGTSGQALTTNGTRTLSWTTITATGVPTGYVPYAFAPGFDPADSFGSAENLAAVSGGNGGALAVPIFVPGPMYLESISIWNKSTANARSAECRLYLDSANDSNTLNAVAGTDATWSFTPTAEDLRTSTGVSGAPVALLPGMYWLVIRNTSATQTFQVGRVTSVFTKNVYATKSIAALGATLDFVA